MGSVYEVNNSGEETATAPYSLSFASDVFTSGNYTQVETYDNQIYGGLYGQLVQAIQNGVGSGDLYMIRAIEGMACVSDRNEPFKTVQEMTGVFGFANHDGYKTTVTKMAGVVGGICTSGGDMGEDNVVGDMSAFDTFWWFGGSATAVTNCFGIRMPTPTGSLATLTNLYGIYVEDYSAFTTPTPSGECFNILSKGVTSKNKFEGTVEVGNSLFLGLLGADPVSPSEGQMLYNSIDKQYKGYDGTSIVILG